MRAFELHTDLNGSLAIAELLQLDFGRVLAETITDMLYELGVGAAGEDAAPAHFGGDVVL